jgi:biofilm PGA synthesis N-glycosyltransferase PgaC
LSGGTILGRGLPSYILITAARNEERFIEKTILSVVHQTVLPTKWVIVSDGSTDGTDRIVETHANKNAWIKLLRMPERKERHFAGKAIAFNAGYANVKHLVYDVIGNLDADISFGPDYFEYLLDKFFGDRALGVAGTPFSEGKAQYDYRFSRKEHVSGACQLFARPCFESIGGYTPLKAGAVDLVAVVTARMNGWRTETFTERVCVHHRPMGSAKDGPLRAAFKSGFGDYRMGVHPLWQFLRSVYQMSRKPFVVVGCALLSGYFWGVVSCAKKSVSAKFVHFRRREQMGWLKESLERVVHPRRLSRG